MAKKAKRTLEDGYSVYELPEIEVTTEPYYKKFLNGLPLPVQQYLQSEASNVILARQVGSIGNPSYGTISKKDVERNKRNYFDVQALNTAMGSPYVMNQNSFNYNPNVANQQLQYGAAYPISTINNAFETALGDMLVSKGMNMIAKKAMPITFSRMLNKSVKTWDGTVDAEYFHDPYSWYRLTNSTESAGISELGEQFTTKDMPKYASIDNWRRSYNSHPGISVKKDGYYVNPKRRILLRKNGSPHGNTSQASKGKIWEGTISDSPLFKRGVLEGQAPVEVYQGKSIKGGDSRTNFILTPWDDVPNGARIGFHSKEMPLQGLRWFEAKPNGRYKYQGEVIPEHTIRIKHKNGGNVINDKYKYNNWLRTIGAIKGWDPNEMANDLTYDYKLFYNLQPKEAKSMLNRNPYAHFTDIGKTALHPSFSDESYYSGWKSSRNPRGIIGGRWSNNGHRYTLSQSQIDNNWDIRNTINYLSLAEPNGVELRMPNGTRPYIDGAYFEKVLPQVEVIAKRKRK